MKHGMKDDMKESHCTMTTYPTSGTPTRSRQERTREEWASDNKENAEAEKLGLWLIKPMAPNDWGMY
jgi:hypothetical protein